MKYKYRRGQIFGKRLPVPKTIRNKVYDCALSFNEFVKYELDDKIPISCIIESDRKIVEKFGIDKCKKLDWELINTRIYNNNLNFRNVLMSIDSRTDDINLALYELVKDQIRPNDYSLKMKEIYSDRLFELSQIESHGTYDSYSFIHDLKHRFNEGEVGLREIISNWSLFKNKDLSYCLLNGDANKNHITDAMVKEFMSNYKSLVSLIIKHNNIYSFISRISTLNSDEERQEFIKQFTDDILNNTNRKYDDYRAPIELTDEDFKEIFKYSSVIDYLTEVNYGSLSEGLIKELKELPENYLFTMSIPFSALLDSNVLYFIGKYGLKNVVDFDNECGHFFSNNNCRMLKLMYDMYLHYANESYPNNPYTKDEFYKEMRKMIVSGPTDGRLISKAPDYREITGEFRVRNADLFISEQAPEELQKLFYTKSITPQLLLEHPEYADYLNGKDLSSCFKKRSIEVESNNRLSSNDDDEDFSSWYKDFLYRLNDDDLLYDNDLLYGSNDDDESFSLGTKKYISHKNLYKFLESKTDFKGVINFITEYSDVLDIVFDKKMTDSYEYNISFSIDDDMNQIKNRIHEAFRRLIVEKRLTYPTHIPRDLVEKCPSMFLDKNAPQELQEAFYNRTISITFILSNPSYREFLKNVDLEVLFKYMPVDVNSKKYSSLRSLDYGTSDHKINFVKALKQTFGDQDALDIMLLYGKYIEQVDEVNNLENFLYDPEFSQDGFLDELDKIILQNIIDGNMKYNESIPSHFKKNNPTLFLSQDVPQEIRNKFYNREFTLKDFDDNSELFNIFNNTNIACGFSEELSFVIPLFSNQHNSKIANSNRLKVIVEYLKIKDVDLKNSFKDYIIKNSSNLNMKNINAVSGVLFRLNHSNSLEIQSLKNSLSDLLLEQSEPLKSLDKIEEIFIKNNVPLFAKVYSCFKILYPNLKKFEFSNYSRISPELKDMSLPKVGYHQSQNEVRFNIIYNDLLRIAYRSNERSFMNFLSNLEEGNSIYNNIINNGLNIESLEKQDKETLEIFVSHLITLYDNTKEGSKKKIDFSGYNLREKLDILNKLFKTTSRYDLKDRIVRSFCYYAGINSFSELKKLATDSVRNASKRGIEYASELEDGKVFNFRKGDFVRCVGDYQAFASSLNTGNVSKEFLTVFTQNSNSDKTPLDVDFTFIEEVKENIYETIKGTPTGFGFGNVYVVVKKDNPSLNITRDEDGYLTNADYDPSKIEMFGTKVSNVGYRTHWGARTGFAYTDVDYILYKKTDTINDEEPYDKNGNVNYIEDNNKYDDLSAIKFEIARNGYYIPVVDFSGKLIFTVNEYNDLRRKMMGLSYYRENSYKFSDKLLTPEIEYIVTLMNSSNKITQNKKQIIDSTIQMALNSLGLQMKKEIDGDLTEGSVELIDTGSTGRGTNVPLAGDFDFMMRVDNSIISNPRKMQQLKDAIVSCFVSVDEPVYTSDGNIRFKGVKIKGLDEKIDLDITFTQKLNQVVYSTDMCIRDRLETIKKIAPEKHDLVIANIVMAKKVLKEAGVYKSMKSKPSQGGLGGVGVENWILQNGGSFIEAAEQFLMVAENKDFSQFKEVYKIWDFGQNHKTAKDNIKLPKEKKKFLYDNFVVNNMNEDGYKKMVQALREYLNSIQIEQIQTEGIKR